MPPIQGPWRPSLGKLGYVDGKNLILEQRFAEGRLERLPRLAAELVNLHVDVLVTIATPATLAAKAATATIPIVMSAGDPVGVGIIQSLKGPEGNITGVALNNVEVAAKRLQLLAEALPGLFRVAVLANRSPSRRPRGNDAKGAVVTCPGLPCAASSRYPRPASDHGMTAPLN